MRASTGLALLVAGAAFGSQESLPAGVADIVAAERAFARRAGEVGVRESFLEYFAADAISYQPDPAPARPRLEKRPKLSGPPPVLAEWGPAQAEIARGGDMGWSTGPAQFTDKSGKSPPYHGYYFSIWKKLPDGQWKVALDIGVEAPAIPIPGVAEAVGPVSKTAPPADPAWGPAVVERADQAFCRSAEAGPGKAYAQALAANARVHREKQAPLVGRKMWARWAKGLSGVLSCKPTGSGASRAPGFGYAYGSWERREAAGGAVVAKGYYARVWRWDGGSWKIAVDVSTALE